MTWKDRLIKEAEDLVNHGEGQLVMMVGERSGVKTSIVIDSKKTHRIAIDKIKDD